MDEPPEGIDLETDRDYRAARSELSVQIGNEPSMGGGMSVYGESDLRFRERRRAPVMSLRDWLEDCCELAHLAPALTRDGFSSIAALRAPHLDDHSLEVAIGASVRRAGEKAALLHAISRLRSVVLSVRVVEAFDLPRSRAVLRSWRPWLEPPVISVRAKFLKMTSSTSPSQHARRANLHAIDGAPVHGFHANWGMFEGGRWTEGYLLSFSAVQVEEVRNATLRLELVRDRIPLCAIELEGSRLSWQPLPPHSYTLEGCDAVLRVQPWLQWLSQL
jgi:hypothetical protein